MDEKTLFLQLLTKVYNKTEDEINAHIYDDEGKVKETAFEELAALDAARVSRFGEEKKKYGVNQYARAKEEVLKLAESKFKEKTGFEGDAENFDALVEAYHTMMQESISKKSKTEITPELVRQHAEYLKLEKDRIPKAEYEKLLAEHNQYKTSVERKEKFSVIKARARQILETMKPALPEVAAVRDNLVNTYLNALEQYDFVDDGTGNFVAVKGGERVQDTHGNPVNLDALARTEAANWFTFLKQDPKASAANTSTDPGNQSGANIVITSKDQYTKLMQGLGNSPEDAKKRVDYLNAYREAVKSGKLTD